ncbi:linear amide C-N hydrolase [Bosea sp. CS1GBMeth4]|uniref:linear amide C-N hydrolase n=1 Tax=Bosea sp. CS1GBMeth4 TaxID=1892849 RepID=UPI001FCE7F00|nr:linear amide C-N hydrolase [Bosea sp. CS1GBMeth4]
MPLDDGSGFLTSQLGAPALPQGDTGMLRRSAFIVASLALGLAAARSDACTRILYGSGAGNQIVGRTLDWMEDTGTHLWAFPKGMQRDGGIDSGSIKWASRYGSVVASIYDIGSVDGMNEVGLVGNMLYLAEANYGTEAKVGKATLSIGAWLQYALDNYATVAEAVKGLQAEPFRLVAPKMPTGDAAGAHLALADASGDSAIFEYVDGKLVVHHGRDHTVMTNSPTFDKQLTINSYWDEIGGGAMLPGTYRAADRFVRATYNLKSAPKATDSRTALASVFSMTRNISVPLGIADPRHPNIATTIWRTVSDITARRYYYESVFSPSVFWVDLAKMNLSAQGAKPRKLDLKGAPILSGEVSDKFAEAAPFAWLH